MAHAHDLLSPYRRRPSLVHRLPAGLKLAIAVSFVFAVVMLPRSAWTAYGGCAAALLLIAAFSRISAFQLARRLLLVEPFAVGVALLSLLQRDGLRIFAAMLARSTLCLCCMVLLSSTTRFSEILSVLRVIRVPGLLATTLALMHRYLFVLVDEMVRMLRARKSRTFRRSRLSLWRASAGAIAQLFVRSSERAERIYAAMCARGWRT